MKQRRRPIGLPPAELVALVYEWAVEPEASGEPFARIQEHLGADCLQVLELELPRANILQSQLALPSAALELFERHYVERWGAADPLAHAIAASTDGLVRRCTDAAPDAPNAFQQQFLEQHGLRWAMGGMFQAAPGRATLLMARGKGDSGPFDDTAAAALTEILVHLRRALGVRAMVARRSAAADTAAEVLRQLPFGYVVTDQHGRCIESNQAFRHASERLGMRLVMGRLRFARMDQHAVWERALQETHATGVERTIRPPLMSGPPCGLVLKPWRRTVDAATGQEQRLILAYLDERPVPAAEPIEAHFPRAARLTRAEMEVLASMLTGMPAKTIASQRGASVNTVRTQIMAILDKTGFRSQRELIASFAGTTASGFVESAFSHSSFPASQST